MHFDEEIAAYPFLVRTKLKNLAGLLTPEVPLPALMRLTGADPARVREVARTASSPADLPPAVELHGQIAELMGVQS